MSYIFSIFWWGGWRWDGRKTTHLQQKRLSTRKMYIHYELWDGQLWTLIFFYTLGPSTTALTLRIPMGGLYSSRFLCGFCLGDNIHTYVTPSFSPPFTIFKRLIVNTPITFSIYPFSTLKGIQCKCIYQTTQVFLITECYFLPLHTTIQFQGSSLKMNWCDYGILPNSTYPLITLMVN